MPRSTPPTAAGNPVGVVVTAEDADDPRVAEMLVALCDVEGLPVRVVRPGTPLSGHVVLVVSRALGACRTSEVERQVASALTLIPVALDVPPGTMFPDLSQLSLDTLGAARVAGRVATIVRAGGGASYTSWSRLEAAAAVWSNAGRPDHALLRSSEVESAVTLLANRPHEQVSHAVRGLVAASRLAVRRRRRRAAALLTAGSVLLAASGLLALFQRSEAQAAEARASNLAATAESVRLAQLAMDLLDGDPDLPHLLAVRALATARTPEAIAAARRVQAAAPEHRTHPLSGPPVIMSTAEAGRTVALADTNGRVDVVDLDVGGPTTAASVGGPTGPAVEALTLTADGSALAVARQGQPVTVHRAGDWATAESTALPVGVAPRAWLTPTALLFTDADALRVYDTVTGAARDFAAAQDLRAYDVSADGSRVVLLLGSRVEVRSADGTLVKAAEVPAASDVALSSAGEHVAVARGAGEAVVAQVEDLQDTDGAPRSGVSGSTVASAGDLFVLASGAGRVAATRPGTNSPQAAFVAHRGPVVAAGGLAGGAFATVGGDGLRVWESLPASPSYPGGLGGIGDLLTGRNVGPSRESSRSLLAVDASGDVVMAALQGEHAVQLVTDGLRPLPGDGFVPSLGQQLLRPSRARGVFLLVRADSSDLFDVATGQSYRTAFLQRLDVSSALTAISDDGTHGAYAVPGGHAVWQRGQETAEPVPSGDPSTPVALRLVASRLQTVHASGVVLGPAPDDVVRATPEGVATTAAGWSSDGQLVAVGADNQVYVDGVPGAAAVPADLDPVAVVVGAASRRVAVIGVSSTVVLDTATGALELQLDSRGPTRTAVTDVALLPDGEVVAVRSDGGVERWPPVDGPSLARALAAAAPRTMTEEEERLVRVSGAQGTRP